MSIYRFKMASCSIREELVAEYPTCIDYTTISSPTVRVMPIQSTFINRNRKSITEDGEQQRVHVVLHTERRIGVYNYQGRILFSYPIKNLNRLFRGMCIRNNIVYLTTQMFNEILFFTTEGDLITLYKNGIQKGVNGFLRHPHGIVSDENNNIYICTAHNIVVMNSALPVYQKHIIDKERPKYIQLFREEIFILCLKFHAVSINVLSLACVLLRTINISGFESGKPWSFDIDHFGNFVIPKRNSKRLYVYSKDGKMIVNLKLVVKPMGIKLLDNKRRIGVTSSFLFGFCLF